MRRPETVSRSPSRAVRKMIGDVVALAAEHVRVVLADREVVFDDGYASGHSLSKYSHSIALTAEDAEDAEEGRGGIQIQPRAWDRTRGAQDVAAILVNCDFPPRPLRRELSFSS